MFSGQRAVPAPKHRQSAAYTERYPATAKPEFQAKHTAGGSPRSSAAERLSDTGCVLNLIAS